MRQKEERLDTVFRSDIIQLPQIKIASNHLFNKTSTVLHETALTSPFDRSRQVVLTFMIKGKLQANYGGIKKTIELTDQTCSFVFGPQDNYHIMAPDQQFESFAIGVDGHFLSALSHEDPWMDKLVNRIEKKIPFSATADSYKITPASHRLLLQIRDSDRQGSLRGLYQHARVCELLMLQIEQIRQAPDTGQASALRIADHQKLKDLKNFLDTHYLDYLTLDQLAKISGLNTFKIKTGFKALFGKTVFEYLRHLRMEYAAGLIAEENISISEVADLLGYEYVQHFSAAFKKHFGASPNKYL